MKRSRRALALTSVFLLVGIASGGAYLARPVQRARYHLARVTPDELKLEGELPLSGHALACHRTLLPPQIHVTDRPNFPRKSADSG